LGRIIGEFIFFDDQEAVSIRLNQPKVMKSLHEQTDPGPRRSHRLADFFMGYPELDANAVRDFHPNVS
jgi:hypothetical protein